jgi:translation initiation factor 2 alpha subunit (eIF-2alpha)
VYFSIDKWNNVLFLADTYRWIRVVSERIERAETMILDVRQLENSGTILDLGLSKILDQQTEKICKKKWISNKTFLDISKETMETSDKETQKKGATFEFEVSKENFDFMETWFEKPSEIEMIGGITVLE